VGDAVHKASAARKRLAAALAVVIVAASLQILGANPAAPQSPELMAYRATSSVGMDPHAGIWRRAPRTEIPLTAQQSVWPFGGSVPMLEARALHRDGMLYIRLQWDDTTRDDDVTGIRDFVDAAAVEFPAAAATSVPALCMGQADNGVNIWQWRAGGADGRPHDITELSANGYVDRYPSTDDLYFPGRAAGNVVSQPHAVQDLVATGFGSLEAAVDQEVRGAAIWEHQEWSVVFSRELTNGAEEKISLGEGASTDVAFAVWDGREEERNGLKSISTFVSLRVVGEDAPSVPRSDTTLLLLLLGSLGAIIALGVSVSMLSGQVGRLAR
jgi:hypothetical protein